MNSCSAVPAYCYWLLYKDLQQLMWFCPSELYFYGITPAYTNIYADKKQNPKLFTVFKDTGCLCYVLKMLSVFHSKIKFHIQIFSLPAVLRTY